MNKISKGAIAGTLVLFLAGSSAFAATTSSSTTTIKTSTANGVTTTTTTTTTKTTETKTTTATTKKDDGKKNTTAANKTDKKNDKKHAEAPSPKCTKKDHYKCNHKKFDKNDKHNARPEHKNGDKVANCPHTKECKDSKTCEQLKAKSAKLTCNGKPNCPMHSGTYYENKYHKVTEAKNNNKTNKHKDDFICKYPAPEEDKPMKKLPSKKTAVENENVGYKITISKK